MDVLEVDKRGTRSGKVGGGTVGAVAKVETSVAKILGGALCVVDATSGKHGARDTI